MLATLAAVSALASSPIAQLRLVGESRTYVPGSTLRAAVVLDLPAGWHVYWTNPGDSGVPPRVRWKLPRGWTASEPAHPTPKAHRDSEFVSYVHEGKVLLPVRLQAPRGARGTARIVAEADWLVCKEGCVPESGVATLTLEEGRGLTPSGARDAVARAFASLPSTGGRGTLRWEGDRPIVGASGFADAAGLEVFPMAPGTLSHRQPVARAERTSDGWRLELNRSEFLQGRPGRIEALLIPTDASGRRIGPGRAFAFEIAAGGPQPL